jgi:hypothetical protein
VLKVIDLLSDNQSAGKMALKIFLICNNTTIKCDVVSTGEFFVTVSMVS